MSVTYLIFDKSEAQNCKNEGYTYELYVSYMNQYDYEGNTCVPMREQEYNQLIKREDICTEFDTCGECNECSKFCDVCGMWYWKDESCSQH